MLPRRSLSAPTVAATRSEAWVVRDGTDVVRVPAGAAPQAVSAPTLQGLGRADVLRLSPDGVRAALVVDGPAGSGLYVGTVVRAEDGGVELRDLRGDRARRCPRSSTWRGATAATCSCWPATSGRTAIDPYAVGVDGWGLVTVPSAGPAQPAGVASPRRRPASRWSTPAAPSGSWPAARG